MKPYKEIDFIEFSDEWEGTETRYYVQVKKRSWLERHIKRMSDWYIDLDVHHVRSDGVIELVSRRE